MNFYFIYLVSGMDESSLEICVVGGVGVIAPPASNQPGPSEGGPPGGGRLTGLQEPSLILTPAQQLLQRQLRYE